MEVRRTAPVKLVVPDERREDLHESAWQFLHCANRATEFCWSDRSHTECVTANTTARNALYDELREETELTANLVQEAIRRAVQAVTGCVERWKQGKRVSQPEFTSWSMLYDKRSATFYRNKVSLSTINGRVECEFELPSDSPTPYERYVLSKEFEFRASTLQYDAVDDEFYFHITTRKYDSEGDDEPSEGSEILSTKQSSVSTSASTVSPSPRLGASGRETTTTTGAVSSRSDVVRCNNAARKLRITPCFASVSERKHGGNSTFTPLLTRSLRRLSNTIVT